MPCLAPIKSGFLQNLQVIGGHQVFVLPSVDSTNNYATKLLRSANIASGTVILSYSQLQGKGQRGQVWESEPGKNLTLSMVISKPQIDSKSQFYLNKAIAIALRHFVYNLTNKPTSIKWPNDILVEEQKIAGILIENAWQQQKVQHSIIGIGININQTTFENFQATSVASHIGHQSDLMECLGNLLESIDVWLNMVQRQAFQEIEAEYHTHLFGLQTSTKFLAQGKYFDAKILGVTEDGKLLLESNQQRKKYDLKELKFIY
ncbi:MAG: BirA family biotin operon repressor/biotin-[acetyl-CoA-carboxylase] ligase [Flavobacteriales bacterium]